jgi:TPR repeat protein
MPKERNKADGYREKAYEGDTKAMNNLGVCYERGTGVKVNLEMAFEWYMKATEQGDKNFEITWHRVNPSLAVYLPR